MNMQPYFYFYLFWPAFTSQFERGQQDLHAKVREGIGQKALLRLGVQFKAMEFIFFIQK